MKAELKQFYKKTGLICLFLLLLCSCRSGDTNYPGKLRLGVLPHLNSQKIYTQADADLFGISNKLYVHFLKYHSDKILFLPVEWTFQAIDLDSLTFRSYLRDYGLRLDLDYTILIHSSQDSHFSSVIYQRKNKRQSQIYDLSAQNEYRIVNEIIDALSRRMALTQETDSIGQMCCDSLINKFNYYKFTGQNKLAGNSLESGCDNCERFFAIRLQHELRNNNKKKIFPDIERKSLSLNIPAVEKNLLLAEVYMRQENWNRCIDYLKLVLEEYPEHIEALLMLARAHPNRFKTFGYKSRKQILEHILQINPACERAAIFLADIVLGRNDHKSAHKIFEKMLFINPRSLDAWMALGREAMLSQNIPEMIQVFQAILEIDPEYADAYYNLGIAYYHQGDLETAGRLFKKCIELDGNRNALYYLGVISEAQGEKGKAIEWFRERLRQRKKLDEPFSEESRVQLYRLLQEVGENNDN